MASQPDLIRLRWALLDHPADAGCWQTLIAYIQAIGGGLLLGDLDDLFVDPITPAQTPQVERSGQLFSTLFENAFPGMTLQQVLAQGGGGIKALGRHTVSAYFNAVALGPNYELTPQQVVDKFNAVNPSGNINGLINELSALQDVTGRICPNPTGK